MSSLIKRYIIKAQRDTDKDKVNEGKSCTASYIWITTLTEKRRVDNRFFASCPTGELKDIKQDICRLRYELLDRGKRGVNPLAELVRQLDEAV